jgi:glycine oxidase
MLLPQAEADTEDQFFTLACRSRELYSAFAAELFDETGIDVELDTTGTLYVALTEHDREAIEKRYQWQSRAGLAVELLSDTAARNLEPCINPTFGALLFPQDIQVENRGLLDALAKSVNRFGVVTLTGINVNSLIVEGDRVTGVETNHGRISCATVVVAAGTWSDFIQRPSRCPSFQVEPVRGQMICLESRPQLTRHVIYSPRGYLVPRRDGRLLAGSTSEKAGFNKNVTAGGISLILRHAQEISEAISHLPIVDTWAGLRPRAADGLPVLGSCGEIDGLFYATGHYRNGILLAPLTGELISQAIVEGTKLPMLESFSPDRFSASRCLCG